ncbi:MAG: tyrosine recombinase [Actinobacteria bacterium]|nr:tyrosine recombinase [Actinomycetota bacterium]
METIKTTKNKDIELGEEFQRLLVEFEAFLLLERRLSKNTVKAYISDVQEFLLFLKKRKINVISKVDASLIEDFMSHLALSERSKARLGSSLRSFFKFLLATGNRINIDPDEISLPKIPKYLPVVFSVEEVTKLIDSVSGTDFLSVRDRAILEVLYATGMRVSELINLTTDRVDLKEQLAIVVGKGNKERIVPFGRSAREALERWLTIRSVSLISKGKISNYVFLSKNLKKLTRDAVFRMLKKRALACGIRKISPHSLRHSCATHMIENGADLRAVQEILGHSNLTTTEIYTHVSKRMIKKIFEEFHPWGKNF